MIIVVVIIIRDEFGGADSAEREKTLCLLLLLWQRRNQEKQAGRCEPASASGPRSAAAAVTSLRRRVRGAFKSSRRTNPSRHFDRQLVKHFNLLHFFFVEKEPVYILETFKKKKISSGLSLISTSAPCGVT